MAATVEAAAGPRIPLSEEAQAAALLNMTSARAEAREIERRERENAHASVVLGKRLAAIQHFKQHDLERCKSFDFWVEKNMPFRIKQARLYISVAHLPLDLVEGCRLSLTKLRLVAGAPAWARPALLLHSDRGTWESDLKRAIKAGEDHHQLYEDIPEATAHLIEVLEGATALRKARRVDDPEAIGDEAISALQKFLASVQKLGKLGVPLAGRWVKQLVCLEGKAHAELSLLLRSARTDTPKSEGEMMDACAAAMRAGRSGGRGEDELGAVADVISDLDATQRSTKPGAERPGVVPDLAARAQDRAAQDRAVQVQDPVVQDRAAQVQDPVVQYRAAQDPIASEPPAASPPESADPTDAAASPSAETAEAAATPPASADDAPPSAPQPVTVGWPEVYAAIRGALSEEQQRVLVTAMIAQLCEVTPAERDRARQIIGGLVDIAEQIEGPGKLPSGAMRSLVQLVVREPLPDRWWFVIQVLGECGFAFSLEYLHACREMMPLGYRLHHDDVCARTPKPYVPDSKTEPAAFAAWVAEAEKEALDFMAERKAQIAAAKAEKRRLRGW